MSRPDVSTERRPQIVDAAIRVFIRKGYRKATMPDIAAEAGLSVGGVYWYYKGRDEIVSAIRERAFDEDFGALAALIGQGIERGEFRPVAPAVAATALLGMEEGLSLLLAVDPQGTRWRESFLLGCELLIAGLRAPVELLTDHTDDTDQREEESVSSV
jgi:AcrR family transcriptional regulator